MNERIDNKRSITTSNNETTGTGNVSTQTQPQTHQQEQIQAATQQQLAQQNPITQQQQQQSSSNPEYSNTAKKCRYHRYKMQDPRSQHSASSKRQAANESNPVGANSSSCSSSNSNTTNSQIPDPLSGTRFAANSKLISDRYLVFDTMDGSSFYNCIDICDKTPLQCKIMRNPCSTLLTAHFRLDGHIYVNQLVKAITENNCTYVFFTPTEGDLHSYVRVKKRLRESEAKLFFRQMCEIVKACHEQGIILRDLKLRKFVFASPDKTHLKLETLEDAVILDDPSSDLLQDKRGCPAYVSPEILRVNTKYSGKAADIWALGVILYTMLVGRYPFNDSEHTNLFAKISRGHYVIPECLSAKARCMIRALLRRDSSERITSSDVLHHPWLMQTEQREYYPSNSACDDQMVPQMESSSARGNNNH
ncbi:tribbles homolog 2 [Culicoides brevitarsis]|uniref:tribbles homolog 2 n=1 Tax=Culicoides brevitarsis TaxID=469753 RepID=UPI00307BC101